ncbi:MAG: alpha/beta hydrolase [Verrucomicrobiae bacterium]|nr:alpha/beta hydrolase [Verrucomicrobiae bacterium]NNJ86154.1 prolyl oligopeptidase family serine peptidase [Akkermansiaceae bacterium]
MIKSATILTCAIGLCFAGIASAQNKSAVQPAPFPGKESLFQGKFKMYKNGANIVVVPNKTAEGKPWVWRARFWRHQPQFDLAMLEKGYHLVYCNVSGLYGNPTAVERWNKYYKWLVEEHGFSKKPVLEGMSRGGLIVYNWAIANPDKVAAIYGDAPVMDMRSWPGAGNKATLRTYKFKDAAEASAYQGYPVDNLKPLAQAGVPIIHVVGDADKVVPVAENTAIAEKRYKALGGIFKVIHKKEVGHHPHSLKDPTPIVQFIEQHMK